jgi:PAS domain S-box-containing protein
MWIYDLETLRFLDINKTAAAKYGYSKEEFLTMTVNQIHEGGDTAALVLDPTDIHGTIQGRTLVTHRKKDGSLLDVEITADGLIFEGRQAIRVIANDMTEQKRSEAALRESEAELLAMKFALDQSSIVAMTDQTGKIDYVNDKFCEISGYTREELIGQDHRLVNSDYHSAEFIRNLWTTIASGEVWHGEIRNRAKDGHYYWVDTTIVPFLDDRGKPYQYVAIRNDITETKLSEEALRDSETQFRTLAETASDGIITIDDRGVMIFVNIGAVEIFGYSEAEMIGQNITMLMPETMRYQHTAGFGRFVTTGRRNISWKAVELPGLHRDGHEIQLELSFAEYNKGGIRCFTSVIRDITRRKESEAALQRSEDQFRRIIEHSSYGKLLVNEQGVICLVNGEIENRFGYSRDELLGQSMEILIPHRYRPNHSRFLGQFKSYPSPRPMGSGRELFGLRKDGSEFPVEIGLNPLPSGQETMILATITDITDRKKAETELRQSEERYRELFENNPFPMWVYGADSLAFLAVNDAACRQYGYSSEEFLSMKITQIRPEEEVPSLLDNLAEADGSLQKSGDWRHRRKDGSELFVEVTSHEINFLGQAARLVLANDVTDRRKAEIDLRSSEERYRALASSAQMVWISDSQGHLSNPAENWTELTGLSAEDSRDYWWLKGVHPDDREFTLQRWKQAIDSKSVYEVENRVQMADGSYKYFYSRGVPVFNGDGRVREWVGMSIDVSDRKRAEEDLHRLNLTLERRVAERTVELQSVNQELESFAYSVSHDLRAPLRAMDGFSLALLEDYGKQLDETGKNFLTRVRSASQQMSRLIDDLLSLSRVTRTEVNNADVDLSLIAYEILTHHHDLQPRDGFEMDVQSDIKVFGDERLLRIALENLLGNAWKFTSKAENPRISFKRITENNGNSVYCISDNGAGFDMKYADKLFGAFQRLHSASDFEGTGIGLATVQRIINRHGGRIWAEGEVGKGAAFYFTL